MTDLLQHMAQTSQARADRALPLAELKAQAADRPLRPLTLRPGGTFGLIAEVKLAAPSAGAISQPEDPKAFVVGQAQRYAEAGAAAISVLTEPLRFHGELSYLAAASTAVSTPTMRKDFLVDPIQIWEGRAAGASMVLLIARMLPDLALYRLGDSAQEAGLTVLLEAFDEVDLERCGAFAARYPGSLVGVNTRDLRSLQVVPDRLARLAPHLPRGVIAVAESGMHSPEDVAQAAALGYHAALVGTALMRAQDPGVLVQRMTEAACSSRSAG